jgi:hypothetical protein
MNKTPLSTKIDEFSKECGELTNTMFKPVMNGLSKVWKEDRIKAYKAIGLFILFVIIGAFLSYFITIGNPLNKPAELNNYQKTEQRIRANGTGAENSNLPVNDNLAVENKVKEWLQLFDFWVNVFAPILDDFVASTQDVSGISNNNTINLQNSQVSAASRYSTSLSFIAYLGITILFAWNLVSILLTIISENDPQPLQSVIKRLIFTILMLIATPYLLSLSIQFTNAINTYILSIGGGEITKISDYLKEYFNDIKLLFEAPDQSFFDIIGNIYEIAVDRFNPVSGVQNSLVAFSIIIPVGVSLLIFLVIIFQFIIRFVKLYFLSAVFPLVVMFYMNSKSGVPKAFWREWTTSLVHQIAFLLGYKILNDIVFDILKTGGWGLTQILIYIATLLFLLSINIITAQLWGNAFSAITDTVLASKALNFLTKPFAMAGASAVGFGSGLIGKGSHQSMSHFAGSRVKSRFDGASRQKAESIKPEGYFGIDKKKIKPSTPVSNSKFSSSTSNVGYSGNTILNDPAQSLSAQRLVQSGYNVSGIDPNEGIIKVSGNWVATDKSNGISVLYQNKSDALSDDVAESKIYEVDEQGFNMLDTVNYQGMKNYANRLEAPILPANTPNKLAVDTLNEFKIENLNSNIQGITTSQHSRQNLEKFNGKPPEEVPRIQKSFIYSDVLKNKK